MKKCEPKALVVTTEHKGVFFGYGVPTTGKTIELTQARMCIYWASEVKGVLGLAVTGPLSGCRIGPAVSKLFLNSVTACMEASADATTNWEKNIWA